MTLDHVIDAHEAAEGPPRAPANTTSPGVWAAVLAAALALAGGVLLADLDRVDQLGLVRAVGWPYWIAVCLWGVAFTFALRQPGVPVAPVAALLGLAIVGVHGLPALIEPTPRFFSAYLHVGFIEHIGRTQDLAPSYDARFSWWSFFSLGATVADAGGDPHALWMIRWAPVVFNTVWVVQVAALAGAVTRDRRVRSVACALFIAGNWVGQDYLAPQAVGFTLWLGVMVILVRVFPTVGAPSSGGHPVARIAAAIRGGVSSPLAVSMSRRDRGAALVVACAGAAVVATGHQLTPAMLFISAAGLAGLGRTELKIFPVYVMVVTATWLSFGAVDFWRGHLDVIFGGVGAVGSNVSAGFSDRIVVPTLERRVVLGARVAYEALVLLAALLGAWLAWRRGRRHGGMIVLLLSPWSLVLLQSYGGEGFLRAALFSLPAAAVLAAAGFVGAPPIMQGGRERRARSVVAGLLVAGALTPLVLVTRFGNELAEMVRPEELAAMEWVYDKAPPGSLLLATSRNLPWRFERMLDYVHRPTGDDVLSDPALLPGVEPQTDQRVFLILSAGQAEFGKMLYGLPDGWSTRLAAQLSASGRWALVFQSGEAQVWMLRDLLLGSSAADGEFFQEVSR